MVVPQSRSLLICCGLTFLLLAPCVEAAYAQPKFSPSKQFPGPWLEVTQEVRDLLALYKVSHCNQAAARMSSRRPDEYLLYCTQDEQVWTSWRVRPAANKIRGPGRLIEGIPLPEAY